MSEDMLKVYRDKFADAVAEGAELTKEQEFWRAIVEAFKGGKSLKHYGNDFFSLFKKCPQTPIPPKMYMSKEE